MAELPVVAIVGRPNVGKSTLLNRIVGRREAIVEEQPGVTRDRKEVEAEWNGRDFLLVDTGGWLPGGTSLDEKVSRQSERAIDEADLVVVVVDAVTGVTEEDARVASMLRRGNRPTLLAVNKVDDANREGAAWEFVSLGLGDPFPVSALHGPGAGDLLDAVVEVLDAAPSSVLGGPSEAGAPGEPVPPADGAAGETVDDPIDLGNEEPDREELFSVAVVGRPNAGKSTLFNRLIGDDRSVVHDLPGTTRDAIDTVVDTPFGPVRFVDTAGMRRRSRIDEGTEYFSTVRALRAVDKADVAMLVIDATVGVTAQDQRLAERIDVAGSPVVVLLNKWELIADPDDRLAILGELSRKLAFIGEAPVLKISALTGKGVHKLRPVLQDAIGQYHRRVPTRDVNRVIAEAQQRQPAGGGVKVLYAVQGATDPPTFTLFANREVPAPYLRYLERSIREAFEFGSTPLKLRVRRRNA